MEAKHVPEPFVSRIGLVSHSQRQCQPYGLTVLLAMAQRLRASGKDVKRFTLRSPTFCSWRRLVVGNLAHFCSQVCWGETSDCIAQA